MKEKPFLPVFFHRINKRMMNEHLKIFKAYDLNRIDVPVIMTLKQHEDGLYQSEIARLLSYNRAHISRTLKELCEREFVYQEDINTYKNRYFITDKGLQVGKDVEETGRKIREHIFSVLTEDEVKEFERIIKKIIKIL